MSVFFWETLDQLWVQAHKHIVLLQKSIFQTAFVVCSTQRLVGIYNTWRNTNTPNFAMYEKPFTWMEALLKVYLWEEVLSQIFQGLLGSSWRRQPYCVNKQTWK